MNVHQRSVLNWLFGFQDIKVSLFFKLKIVLTSPRTIIAHDPRHAVAIQLQYSCPE